MRQYSSTWVGLYVGKSKLDEYNQPLIAPDSWWKGLDQKVREILITGGKDEAPFDHIEELANRLKVSTSCLKIVQASVDRNEQRALPNLTTVFIEGETHAQPFLEFLPEKEHPCQSRELAKSWASRALAGST